MSRILDDSDMQEIYAAMRDTWGTSIEKPKLFRLGRLMPDGSVEVKVPTPQRQGEVWVRNLGEGAGDAVPALNTVLGDHQLIPNDFVEVVPYGGGLRIAGRAPESADYSGAVPVRPQRPVDATQIDVLLLRPTQPASMRCMISSAIVNLDGVIRRIPDLLTKDFTGDIPGANAVAVLITVDPATLALSYTTSTSFDAGLTLAQAFDDYLTMSISDSVFGVGWVKLYAGQSDIKRGDILNGAEFLAKTGGGNTFDASDILTFDGIVLTYKGNVLTYGGF